MKMILWTVLAAFGAYSAWAMWQVGYIGIFEAALRGPGEIQIFLDLVIACVLICSWMLNDARLRGGNAWPYVIVTLFAGSFGPLFYLLFGRRATDTAAGPQYNPGTN